MNKKINFSYLLILLILLLISCDSGGNLRLKNHSDNNIYKIDHGKFHFEIYVHTLSNIYIFDIPLIFSSSDDICIYSDSLKIFIGELQVQDLNIRHSGELITSNKVILDSLKNIITYSFILDENPIINSDELVIYGPNFIEMGKQYYSIDSLVFDLSKYYQ